MSDLPSEEQISRELWLKTRPKCVQELAARFPLDCIVVTEQDPLNRWLVIGYNESGMLIVVPWVNTPHATYEEMLADRQYICADHCTLMETKWRG